ncbi:hypothetical protein ZWY2020_035860 [Hordeum vulgare]|nr:hypothetical protein ZWY2020_035860 [Hordeum vulgare]
MDYSLAVLKLFTSQPAGSTTAPSSEGSFPMQGVVVRADYSVGDGRLFVDDGSCVTELMLRPEDAKGQPWRPGTSWRLRELTLLFHEFCLWSCPFSCGLTSFGRASFRGDSCGGGRPEEV